MENTITSRKINERWYLEITEEAKKMHEEAMKKEGFVRVEEPHPLGVIVYYVRGQKQ